MEDLKKRIVLIKQKLDLDKLKKEISEIEALSTDPNFWQDHLSASEKMKRLGELQKDLQEIEELEELAEKGEQKELESRLAKFELRTFLSGKYDSSPAIFSIHAGQGGMEAMDWADMLKRMYFRFFERKSWAYETIEQTAGDGGTKSIIIKVNAPYAYGYLKLEAGTHRLVRQSPFNADHLRQTSFALVEVLPQLKENSEIEVKDDDLEWQFYRASSQGGQNVQKVSSAVRLIYKPTNLVITCQTERYQEQNRKIALELLQAKLWALKEKEIHEKKQQLKGGKTMAGWGTQIRSYVLHPYKMVKDLRTNFESSNPDDVLDGNLEGFIEAELKSML